MGRESGTQAAPTRILHVIHRLGDGGADRALTRLVNASDPLVCRHTILALEPGPGHGPLSAGVRLVGPCGRHPEALIGRLDDDQFDVVHGWVSYASILAATLAAVWGLPLVLRQPTNMELELEHEPTLAETYWQELKLAYQIADAVVVPSSALVESTRRVCGVFAPIVIPNSIDVGATTPWRTTRPEGRPIVFASVGRLSPQKDPLALVEAVGRIGCAFDWRLRMFGDGNLRAACEARAAALGVRDRVEFRGFDRDWLRADTDIDVFVSATRYEGMSNATLEAAAAGMPIVTTAIPENRAVLTHGVHALLVPPGDTDALAAALTELARRRDLGIELGRRARRRMRHFSLSAMVGAHESLYRRLARAAKKARAA
jgi:glycosyltransferase involved in cell wall biosynthesis